MISFLNMLAVFEERTIVYCLLLFGLAAFSTVSEGHQKIRCKVPGVDMCNLLLLLPFLLHNLLEEEAEEYNRS
jgi:hypothetical protein